MHILIIVTILQILFIFIKKLLNVKYRLIEDKRIDILTSLRAGFKKTDILKQLNVNRRTDCSSDETTFEGLRVPTRITFDQEDLRL